MNLTLSLDDRTVHEARRVAAAMGKSVNQLVREYLAKLTDLNEPARDIQELEQLSEPPRGDARGWRFDRDEIHERA